MSLKNKNILIIQLIPNTCTGKDVFRAQFKNLEMENS